jgi:hypothetical protein
MLYKGYVNLVKSELGMQMPEVHVALRRMNAKSYRLNFLIARN